MSETILCNYCASRAQNTLGADEAKFVTAPLLVNVLCDSCGSAMKPEYYATACTTNVKSTDATGWESEYLDLSRERK